MKIYKIEENEKKVLTKRGRGGKIDKLSERAQPRRLDKKVEKTLKNFQKRY